MGDNNVVHFPKSYVGNDPETDERLNLIRMMSAIEVADHLYGKFLRTLTASGISIEGEEFANDRSLVYEAMVSLLCRYEGIEHGLQGMADDMGAEIVEDVQVEGEDKGDHS